MKRIIIAVALLVIPISIDHATPAFCQEKQQQQVWEGKRLDGTVITEEDLRRILSNHELWLSSDGKEGDRANLSGADLSKALLVEANPSLNDHREANQNVGKL